MELDDEVDLVRWGPDAGSRESALGESDCGSVADRGALSAGVRGDIEALGVEAEDPALTVMSSPSAFTSVSKLSGGTLARERSADKLSEGRSLAEVEEDMGGNERGGE